MTRDDDIRFRSRTWEEAAPAEERIRRSRQSAPSRGRQLPGMPPEPAEPVGDPLPLGAEWLADQPRTPWWRPQSTFGRAFLTLAALLTISGIAVSGYLLKAYLGRDSRFRIAGAENIESSGLNEVSRGEMLPVFGEDIGRNIFFVPLVERKKQLEQIPWVERATVMRLLPDRIRIDVVERQPVAFVRQGQSVRLVDAEGVLLDMPAVAMAARHYSFPVVAGIDPADPLPARKRRMAVYLQLLHELDSSGQHISELLSEIDLTDPEDARVLMPEQGGDILAHFGTDQFLTRYQRYKENIAGWKQQYPKLAAVDLRYERQVVLEMAQGGGVTETAGQAQSDPAATDQAKTADAKTAIAKAAGAKTASAAGPKDGAKPGAKNTADGKNAGAAKSASAAKPADVAQRKLQSTATAGGKTAATPKAATTTTSTAKAAAAKHNAAKQAARKTAKAKADKKKARQLAVAKKERERRRAQLKRAGLTRSHQQTETETDELPAEAAGAGQ